MTLGFYLAIHEGKHFLFRTAETTNGTDSVSAVLHEA